MDPYESIYAGQFVFMLGYLCAAHKLTPDGNSVLLLAQNRGDEVIGDLVASWHGLSFIVEFKRSENTVRTEFDKPAKELLLQHLHDKTSAQAVIDSRRGHFLAFGAVVGRSADMHVLPYADIEDSPKQRGSSMPISNLLDRILRGQVGLEPPAFHRYVSAVKALHSAAAPARPTSGPWSSLLVNYDATTKRFTFVVVDLLLLRELKLERDLSGPELPPRHRRGGLSL
jgi:hypothetical protein